MNLIKSEVRKLTYTKSFWWLVVAASALAILSTAPTPYILTDLQGGQMSFGSLTDQALVDSVYANAVSSYFFVIIVGILMMAGEFRHGTAVATFLAAPNRRSVLIAKLVVSSLAGVFIMITSVAFGFAAGAVALSFYPEAVAPSASIFINTAIAGLLAGAVLGVLGVALGTLIRNQLVAVVLSLVWLFVVEPILLIFVADAGKFLPTGLITSMLSLDIQLDDSVTGVAIDTGMYLEPWQAVLALIGYGVVFSVVAMVTSLRRDID